MSGDSAASRLSSRSATPGSSLGTTPPHSSTISQKSVPDPSLNSIAEESIDQNPSGLEFIGVSIADASLNYAT